MNLREYRANKGSDPKLVEARKQLDLHIRFSEAVIRSRIEKGISQTTLARMVGTKQANISRIEAGIANPTLSLINKIAQALQIEVIFQTQIDPEQEIGQKLAAKTTGKGDQIRLAAARKRNKRIEPA